MTNILNIICGYCSNQLYNDGIVLDSELGPLLMCSTCRGLYYINISLSSIIIKTVGLPQEVEYDLIRSASEYIPLDKYFAQKVTPTILELINSSTTPSDLVRRLHDSK